MNKMRKKKLNFEKGERDFKRLGVTKCTAIKFRVLVSLLIYTSLQCSTTSPSTSSATEPPPPPPLLQHFQLSLPRQSSLFSFEETNR
ncbi:hypothetical protein L1887_34611 [Cichorium endivia]|nr:hypothetical protein L1887_34611 [Cichorium endivia]